MSNFLKWADTPLNDAEKVSAVINQAKAINIDIAATYEEWLKCGFAFKHAFGDEGKKFFLDLSALHIEQNIDPELKWEQINHDEEGEKICLKNKKEPCTLGTFFFLAQEKAKENGKKIVIHSQSGEQNASAPQSNDNDDFSYNFLSKKTFLQLPKILKDIVDCTSSQQEASIVLFSILNGFGAYFNNVFLGAAASGKGVMGMIKSFFSKVEQKKRSERKEGSFLSLENQNKLFFHAAETTSAALIHALADNNGEGVIYASEIDTLSKSNQSTFGNFSNILRDGYDNQHITKRLEKNGGTEFDIPRPTFGLCISGTDKQLRALIGNVEDGLFSRTIFIHTNSDDKIYDDDVEDGLSMAEKIENIGNQFFPRLEKIKNFGKIEISFKKCKNLKMKFLNEQNKSLRKNNPEDFLNLKSILIRACVSARKIACILTVLNAESNGTLKNKIECTKEDFLTSLQIICFTLQHTLDVYFQLKMETTPTSYFYQDETKINLHDVLNALPDTFERKNFIDKYYELKKSTNRNSRTADKAFYRALTANKIREIGDKMYTKIRTTKAAD